MKKSFYLFHPIFIIYRLFPRILPDSLFLKCKFFMKFKTKLNLKNPETFNEKLQWLKIYDRKPEYSMMADKYEVKKFVEKIIGQQYIIPTIGLYNNFEEINFDTLPNEFVLKCTHDSGGLIIVKNKNAFNKVAAEDKIKKCLNNNYYWKGREFVYKNIRPRIIAEPLITDPKNIIDYKFMCFNGKCKYIFTATDRFEKSGLKITFFDTKWQKQDFERHYPKDKKKLKAPNNLCEMIKISEKLSEKITFSRIDLYEIDNKIYFGEITFFPGSGFEEFTPEIYDKKLGDLIELPK